MRTGFVSSYVPVDGARLHVLRSARGGGKPPIVLAHGFSDSAACWASMARALEPDFDVVAYDARGHGLSDAPESGYDVLGQARDLLAIVDALGLERSIWMGHSMGGVAVAWAAILRPELPRALVIEDAMVGGRARDEGAEADRAKGMERVADMFRQVTSQPVAQLLEFARENYGHWPPEDLEPWAESNTQTREQAFQVLPHLGTGDLRERFAEIRCPVLLLKADADEATRADHRQQVSSLPKGRIVHIDGAGHSVRRDRHDATLRALREFLAEL